LKKSTRKRPFRAILWLTIFAALLAASGYGGWWYKMQQPLQVPEQGMIFEIPRGVSVQRVAQDLQATGVIDHSLWMRLYVRLHPEVSHVQAGEYRLEPGLTLPGLMSLFTSGRTVSYPIQFVEGWTFRDVRRELARHEKLVQRTAGLDDAELMELLERPGDHPEGRFFPDTYYFHKGMSDLDILATALRRMDQILAEEWEQRQENLPLKTPYEALILASIIEKETGVPYERAQISGVFVRRLQKGMRLQTDPTVIYGLGENYRGNLTRQHLRQLTPYNTYRIAGLPPTPIALSGREAIHAALNPAPGKELFFVARGDGTHHFSVTLKQHQAAVLKYQVHKRRADYRSSPMPSSTKSTTQKQE